MEDEINKTWTPAELMLHPTLNVNFLLTCFLRVAIASKQCGSSMVVLNEQFPAMHELWSMLVSVEEKTSNMLRSLKVGNSKVLQPNLYRYLLGEIDLGQMRDSCLSTLESMANGMVSPFQQEENAVLLGARKAVGGLGRFTGSLITAAGGILELPSTLLALPYILTNRQELIATVTAAAELEGPAGAAAADIADAAAAGTSSLAQPGGSPAEFRVGTGAKVYLGVAGALAIPGLIAMGLGNFINNAGKSAMRDKLTIQYKQILYVLSELLGGDRSQLLDEVASLEDFVVTAFEKLFPTCRLQSCGEQQVLDMLSTALQQHTLRLDHKDGTTTTTTEALQNTMAQLLKKMPQMFEKLCMVGKSRAMRQILSKNLMISFTGVVGAGKSTLLHELFGVSNLRIADDSSLLAAVVNCGSADVSVHRVGDWVDSVAADNVHVAEWARTSTNTNVNSASSSFPLQLCVLEFPGIGFRPVSLAVVASSNKNDYAGVKATALTTSTQATDATLLTEESLASATAASVSSMFVVVLSADVYPPGAPERAVVDAARATQKPFIIAINKCDLLGAIHRSYSGGATVINGGDSNSSSVAEAAAAVAVTLGQLDSVVEAYARHLDVDTALIHLVSNRDGASVDELRGVLFAMLQGLVSKPVTDVLALKLVPSGVIRELRVRSNFGLQPVMLPNGTPVRVFDNPKTLSAAATSLMLNLCRVTADSLTHTTALLTYDEMAAAAVADEAKERAANLHTGDSFATTIPNRRHDQQQLFIGNTGGNLASEQLRQLAVRAKVPDSTYAVFAHLYVKHKNYIEFQYYRSLGIQANLNLNGTAAVDIADTSSSAGHGQQQQQVISEEVLSKLPLDVRRQIDEVVCVMALSAVKDALMSFLSPEQLRLQSQLLPAALRNTNDIMSNILTIGSRLLMTIGIVIEEWKAKGYVETMVVASLKKLLAVITPVPTNVAVAFTNTSSGDIIDDANAPSSSAAVKISGKTESTTPQRLALLQLLESKMEMQRAKAFYSDDMGHLLSQELEYTGNLEIVAFERMRDLEQELTRTMSFQPIDNLRRVVATGTTTASGRSGGGGGCSPTTSATALASSSAASSSSSGIEKDAATALDAGTMLDHIAATIARTHTQRIQVELPSADHVLKDLLDRLMAFTPRELAVADISFHIRKDSAVDVNGVSRSVITKAAEEISNHPELVFFRRNNDDGNNGDQQHHTGNNSGFVFFDPAACYSVSDTADGGAKDKIGGIGDHRSDSIRKTYRALGRLIGLCLVKHKTGVSLPASFPRSLYKILLGYPLDMSDLLIMNPEVAASLRSLCLLDDAVIEQLEMDFTVTLNDANHTVVPLLPNGESKKVTAHNRMDYVRELARFHLCCFPLSSSSNGSNPIMELVLGVQDICPRELWCFLSVSAMQLAVEGMRNIDVASWKANTTYTSALRDAEHKAVVLMFWSVVEEMKMDDRRELLSFCVGTTSLPARGFEALNPHFTLTLVKATDRGSLPTSHTCFNTLVLPMYASKDIMRQKLIQAARETDVATLGMF